MSKRTQRAADAVRRLRVIISFGLITLCVLVVVGSTDARARAQAKAPPPLKQDESCLACHGQPGMTSEKGKSISIDPAKHAASVHGILGCRDCHSTIRDYPHPVKVVKVQCSSCHEDEASHVPNSVHGVLGSHSLRILPRRASRDYDRGAADSRQSVRSATPMK